MAQCFDCKKLEKGTCPFRGQNPDNCSEYEQDVTAWTLKMLMVLQ